MESSDQAGVLHRAHFSFGGSSNSNSNQKNQFAGNLLPDNSSSNGKKQYGIGIPPSHPHFPPSSPHSRPGGSMSPQSYNPSHSRSLSQPMFFSLDSLPPISPYSNATSPSESNSVDVCMDEKSSVGGTGSLARGHSFGVSSGNAFRGNEGLPPRKGHRRSNSDIPLGFNTMIQTSPLPPIGSRGAVDKFAAAERENSGMNMSKELNSNGDGFKNEEGATEKKSEKEVLDDLISMYMNLDNIDALNSLNSSGTEEKDMDSRASGSRMLGCDSSDNEAESSIRGIANGINTANLSTSADKREGVKRRAANDIAPTARHYRSLSMDSFMDNLIFDEESPKIPRSIGTPVRQHSPSSSIDGDLAKLSLEFGTGEFSQAEMKKILASDSLVEIAKLDPKRAKRILANRQSAARSKERKMRYTSELEHKVQTLQAEATTLSAQVTILQRDSASLTSQNNELKIRLQAMEQQAQLRDALHGALSAEVQRLKVVAGEVTIYQLQQQQQQQQKQQQQQQKQQPNGETEKSRRV